MSIGGAEIIVVLVIALLVFGPNRLPEIGRQVGKAVRQLRQIEQTVKSEISEALDLNRIDDEPVDAQAPYYGDPTNVPTEPEPVEAGALAEADEHVAPPPEFFDEVPGGAPADGAEDGDDASLDVDPDTDADTDADPPNPEATPGTPSP